MSDSRWRQIGGRALGILLYAGCLIRYDIQTRGLENYSRLPSTLVVFNHRRDADTPIIGNVLFGRRSPLYRGPHPVFIAREDLFRTGFLAHYLANWPLPFRLLTSHLSLRPFLWALKAYPMRRIAERSLGEVLEDVYRIFGDLPLSEVLKPEWVEQFRQVMPIVEQPLRLHHALENRFQPLLSQGYGLTKLTLNRFRALKGHERATIHSQLQLFVEMLERGEALQLAPEGAVSRDGRFARIRAGLYELINRPQTLVRVLPVGITYDFMTCERQRVFVNVGCEMTDLRNLRPSAASARVAEAILAQSTITASQLASQLIQAVRTRGGGTITRTQLVMHVAEESERWNSAGLYVDPRLLDKQERERRMDEYVKYCLRSGVLISQGSGLYFVPCYTGQAPLSWAKPEGAIDYISNELTSLVRLLRRYA